MPMRDPDIRALCEFYGLEDPKALGRLLALARLDRERRKAKGWWQHSPRPGTLSEYIAWRTPPSRVRMGTVPDSRTVANRPSTPGRGPSAKA